MLSLHQYGLINLVSGSAEPTEMSFVPPSSTLPSLSEQMIVLCVCLCILCLSWTTGSRQGVSEDKDGEWLFQHVEIQFTRENVHFTQDIIILFLQVKSQVKKVNLLSPNVQFTCDIIFLLHVKILVEIGENVKIICEFVI